MKKEKLPKKRKIKALPPPLPASFNSMNQYNEWIAATRKASGGIPYRVKVKGIWVYSKRRKIKNA